MEFPNTQRWLAPKEQFEFQEEIIVVLKNWSFLQNDILNKHWQTKIMDLKNEIISFFTQSFNPDVNSVVVMLRESTRRLVRYMFHTGIYVKAAEELLTIHQDSMTFEKEVEAFIENWTELHSVVDSFKFIKTDLFIPDLLIFCSRAIFDADVDGFAKTISNAIRKHCGETVEVGFCKKVAEKLCTMLHDYLKVAENVDDI